MQQPTRFEQRQEEAKIIRKIVSRITAIVIGLILLAGIIGFFYVNSALKPVDKKDETLITVDIPIGSGINTIADILEDKGLIKSAQIFKYYAKFNNESDFQAGSYELTKAMTPDELIKSLKSGKVYRTPELTLTIPEGLTVEQVAELVADKTSITKREFLEYVNDPKTIDHFIKKYPRIVTDDVKAKDIKVPLEGYLYPATYPFYEKDPSVEKIVDAMIEGTAINITPLLEDLEAQGKSVHWLLTFASLLEREATASIDRSTIASVFYNRIDQGMPLQTDPTVLYALGKHKHRVLYKDLEIDDPYNTYKYKGLPPGPIAGAGMSSIEATMNPADTDYIYFLADEHGNNYFTDSYEEHLKNRDKYITPQFEEEDKKARESKGDDKDE